MKKIAIILPIYIIDEENLEQYRKFSDSLHATQPDDLYELFIIDNGSKFGTFELEADADFYYRYEEPLGYAKAVNIGFEKVAQQANDQEGADHVVVANADLEFMTEHWLSTMLEVYEDVGGLLSAQDVADCNQRYYPDTSWYSLWMIAMDIWYEVGKLDDTKLNYRFHDQDYSIRLKQAGFNVGRTGLVQVKHVNSATYSKMGRNEDPEEREEMIRRHGVALFSEYIHDQIKKS